MLHRRSLHTQEIEIRTGPPDTPNQQPEFAQHGAGTRKIKLLIFDQIAPPWIIEQHRFSWGDARPSSNVRGNVSSTRSAGLAGKEIELSLGAYVARCWLRTCESRSMKRISFAFIGRFMLPFTTLASHESGTALRTEREAV
jgi:hypothetical protein